MADKMKIISYNTRGLCSGCKRGRLWHELRHLGAEIVLLQETHFVEGSIPHMPLFVYNQWFHAPSPISGARGVTMGIHKQCPLVPTEVQKDPEGRYLFVKGKIQGQCYTIATIYAPNSQTVKFLIKTLDRLEKFREGLLILGGDFNITMDPSLDTSSGKTFLSKKALRCVKKRLRSLHLVDSWRVLHERDRDYSYFSKTHNMYSRIDMIMIDQYHLSLVD